MPSGAAWLFGGQGQGGARLGSPKTHLANPALHQIGGQLKPLLQIGEIPKDIDGVTLAPIGLGAINELWLEFEKA